MLYLVAKDVLAQVLLRTLQFCQQTPFETCKQTVCHALEIHWRTVAREDNLSPVLVQVIEDVEECVLCALESCKFLDVVHNQNIDALVEMHEVIEGVAADGVCILHIEKVGTQV